PVDLGCSAAAGLMSVAAGVPGGVAGRAAGDAVMPLPVPRGEEPVAPSTPPLPVDPSNPGTLPSGLQDERGVEAAAPPPTAPEPDRWSPPPVGGTPGIPPRPTPKPPGSFPAPEANS